MGMSEIDCEFQPKIKYSADRSDNESGQGSNKHPAKKLEEVACTGEKRIVCKLGAQAGFFGLQGGDGFHEEPPFGG